MIEKLIPSKIYYSGVNYVPFYTENSVTKCNTDGTYDIQDVHRYGATAVALDSWYYTKDEATDSMIKFYLKLVKSGNLESKANVYQKFASGMKTYLKDNRPEYII